MSLLALLSANLDTVSRLPESYRAAVTQVIAKLLHEGRDEGELEQELLALARELRALIAEGATDEGDSDGSRPHSEELLGTVGRSPSARLRAMIQTTRRCGRE